MKFKKLVEGYINQLKEDNSDGVEKKVMLAWDVNQMDVDKNPVKALLMAFIGGTQEIDSLLTDEAAAATNIIQDKIGYPISVDDISFEKLTIEEYEDNFSQILGPLHGLKNKIEL